MPEKNRKHFISDPNQLKLITIKFQNYFGSRSAYDFFIHFPGVAFIILSQCDDQLSYPGIQIKITKYNNRWLTMRQQSKRARCPTAHTHNANAHRTQKAQTNERAEKNCATSRNATDRQTRQPASTRFAIQWPSLPQQQRQQQHSQKLPPRLPRLGP